MGQSSKGSCPATSILHAGEGDSHPAPMRIFFVFISIGVNGGMSKSSSLSRNAPLRIGVKRLRQRVNAQQHEHAERKFSALSKKALSQGKGRCVYCGFTAPFNEVHSQNLDPYDMSDGNLVVVCSLCLPYHYVGEAPRKKQLKGLDAGHIQNLATLVYIPDSLGLSAQDMNHLQRALALALTDKNEKENAKKVYEALLSSTLREQTTTLFGTDRPSDFGRALHALTQDEFNQRGQHVDGLRMVYDTRYLEHLGRQLRNHTKTPLVNPSRWEELLEKVLKSVGLMASEPEVSEEGVGIDSVELVDDDEAAGANTGSGRNGGVEGIDNDAFATSLE